LQALEQSTNVMAGTKRTGIVSAVNHEYALVNYTMHPIMDNTTIQKEKYYATAQPNLGRAAT